MTAHSRRGLHLLTACVAACAFLLTLASTGGAHARSLLLRHASAAGDALAGAGLQTRARGDEALALEQLRGVATGSHAHGGRELLHGLHSNMGCAHTNSSCALNEATTQVTIVNICSGLTLSDAQLLTPHCLWLVTGTGARLTLLSLAITAGYPASAYSSCVQLLNAKCL